MRPLGKVRHVVVHGDRGAAVHRQILVFGETARQDAGSKLADVWSQVRGLGRGGQNRARHRPDRIDDLVIHEGVGRAGVFVHGEAVRRRRDARRDRDRVRSVGQRRDGLRRRARAFAVDRDGETGRIRHDGIRARRERTRRRKHVGVRRSGRRRFGRRRTAAAHRRRRRLAGLGGTAPATTCRQQRRKQKDGSKTTRPNEVHRIPVFNQFLISVHRCRASEGFRPVRHVGASPPLQALAITSAFDCQFQPRTSVMTRKCDALNSPL